MLICHKAFKTLGQLEISTKIMISKKNVPEVVDGHQAPNLNPIENVWFIVQLTDLV